MLDPAAIDALVRAGGWTLFVMAVALIGVGVLRKWWVPGWMYHDERARSDRIETALERLSTTVESMADDIAWNVADRRTVRRRGRDA